MLTYSKLNLVLGCFNQNVFSDAKMNIELLKSYYRHDPFSKSNALITKLLKIIEDYNFNDITEVLFLRTFQSEGKSDEECTELINRVKEYKSLTTTQTAVVRDEVKEVCYKAFMDRAKHQYGDDIVGFTEELKKFTYKTNVSNNLSVKNFSELDITDLAQRYSGEGYKSAFKFINDSFTCGGYIPGQMVAVCAAPGCFHGDTEVLTLDGKSMKLKDIAICDNPDYLYVYSYHDKYPRVSKASECRITKYVDHWTVLNIDGTIIKCTDDHEFLLVSGDWVPASKLKPGDSLRSITRCHEDGRKSRFSTNTYEFCSTEGILPSYYPRTHRMYYEYMVSSEKFIPEEGKKYNVHHSELVEGKFNRSNNLPSKLTILTSEEHRTLHCKHGWENDYDAEYANLIEAGKDTRITSDQVRDRNYKNWQDPEYRDRMRSLLAPARKKLADQRNAPQDQYNGASLQRVISVRKHVNYLIASGIINTPDDLNEELFNLNRRSPRVPVWSTAMRYYSGDTQRMYQEGSTYQNHTILSVGVEYCNTPEPAYDMVGVDLYSNYAIKCGSGNSGVIVHNSGKSLFVQNEVANFIKQGKRVHMLTLGDLSELDIATRLTCMIARKPKRVIESDIINYYSMYKDKFRDLLGITVVPSGVVTGREYVDWMLNQKDAYDILVVDYDSNFKKGGESMYDEYGTLYDSMTELTREGKLVFVCTQPKINYWKDEEIPLEGIGESSRKQHILDMVITIGRRHESKMRMGKMNIVKSRRGDLGSQAWIGTSEGLFYPCSKLLYARYRNQEDYIGLFTYEELEGMDLLGDTIDDIPEIAKIMG